MLRQSYSGQKYNYIFKVVLIGASGVGKTSIITRYCDQSFVNKYHSTIGVDFRVKLVEHNDNLVKMQIWDTAGQEQFEFMTTDYQYKGANGIIAVFDLGCQYSFQLISKKIDHVIKNHLVSSCHILLVGNKSDLVENRVISQQDAFQLANKYQLQYIEANVTQQQLVDRIFQQLLDQMVQDGVRIQTDENLDELSLLLHGNNNIQLKTDRPKKTGCC